LAELITGSWRELTPQEGCDLLRDLATLWWVAGGWALDLFLGKATRAHKYLDIGISRKDVGIVVTALSGWEFFEARGGVLSRLGAGDSPRAEVNSLWCKRATTTQWELELMLDESEGEFWVFRRDPRITLPLSSAIRRNEDGIAFLAPEIQLLYKARATRAKDQADFDHVVPHLDREARTWLRQSLARLDPEHVWNSMLKETCGADNL
jgi:hypothetical protein